jgi:hypothetical protein
MVVRRASRKEEVMNKSTNQRWFRPGALIVLTALLSLGSMPAGAGQIPLGARGGEVLLRGGTEVRVRLLQPISSQSAEEGQAIALETVEEVRVGDEVVVRRMAAAEGRIVRADPRHGFGRRGKLALTIDRVEAVDGSTVPLGTESSFRGDDRYSKAAVVTLLFGPFGILVKGQEVEIPAGTVLTAYVRGDRSMRGEGSRP